MVGNPSVPAIALLTLVLHTHVAVAQEEVSSASVDYYYKNKNKSQRKRTKNLRRHSGSMEDQLEQDQYQLDGENESDRSHQQRDVLRNVVDSSGGALFRDLMPAAEDEDDQPSHEMELGTAAVGIDCMARQWYPDFTNPNIMACTNSLTYDPSLSWNNDPSIHEALMFDSSEACCDVLVELLGDDYNNDGKKCSVIDDCPVVASTIATMDSSISRRLACGTLGFHMNTKTERGCINDDVYPPAWAQPSLKPRMFHASIDACCTFFYGGTTNCPSVDVCGGGASPPPPPPPAPGACRWHVDMVVQDGCSNDLNYPKEWESGPARDNMFFDSAEECCARMFSGGTCNKYNRGCEPIVTPQPTPRPIFTTPPPTKRPTPPPTSWPTPKPIIYYVNEASGKCINDDDEPKPEWIKDTYPIYSLCCEDARDRASCLKLDPSAIIPLVGSRVFYIDETSGMCVEDTEIPKPDWVSVTYSVYNSCCDAANNARLCRLARPSSAVDGGTSAPTPTPDPLYYAGSDGLCYNEFLTPKQSNSATYEDFNRCCILASTKPEECIAAGPPSTKSIGPTPVPLPVYYLKDSSSTCIDVSDGGKPDYVTVTFEDYDKCCKSGWDEGKCLLGRPTLPPTYTPSLSPSTPWPTESPDCPDKFDSSGAITYDRGSEVHINQVIYRCKRNQNAVFCNQKKFEPPWVDPGPTVETSSDSDNNSNNADLWEGVWERVGICSLVPTSSPSMNPTTYAPTCTTRWHPGPISKRVCTNSDVYPKMWDYSPFSENYFAYTAKECCEKFYDGRRCRIRDDCNLGA